MAKLIIFSSYIKNKTHSENLVQYISTRDGVEYNNSDLKGEATFTQKKVIDELIEKFPGISQIEEYKNFLEDRSKTNASEFLTEAFGLIEDKAISKEIYLKYISERPRVEKIHAHGLFNSEGEADLKKEIEDIRNHKGVVWTHIISLKREDAERLGYDKLNSWQLLLKTKISDIAENMNIELKNLVWNAAFHNEGHHPHVHLVMYSKDIREGYLKEEGIKKIKSVLMNEIYKEDLMKIKEEKTLTRDEIKTEFEKEIDKAYQNIITKNYTVDDKLINAFFELSKELPSKGRLVYGYQTKEVKDKVDEVVKLIMKNKNIRNLYNKYLAYQKEFTKYYSDKEFRHKPITDDKEFRKLQNLVLGSSEKLKNVNYKESPTKIIKDDVNMEDALEKIDVEKNKQQNPIKENVNEDLKGFPDILKDNKFKALIGNTSIEDKLKKIDNEMEIIRNARRKNTGPDDVEFIDPKKVKEEDIKNELNEIVKQKNYSLKNIEGKFLDVFYKVCAGDKYFKSGVESIDVSNSIIKDIHNENVRIQSAIMAVAFKILESPELKEDFNNYKKACDAYSELKNYYPSKIFYEGLQDVFNGLLSELSSRRKIREEMHGEASDNLKEKILNGASNLKYNYNLNKDLNVDYKDYPKGDRDFIKYVAKDTIFSIADMLYSEATHDEHELNRINAQNRKINRMKRKQDNELNY